MVSVYSSTYVADINLDEKLEFISIPTEIEASLLIYDEDLTDLDWIRTGFFGRRADSAEKRENNIGLSEYDFIHFIYPKLNSKIRNWWKKKSREIEEIDPSNIHIIFVTNLFDFPWALLPLTNNTSIGRRYSVSCNDSDNFSTELSTNDALLMTKGKMEASIPQFDGIFGSNLKIELAVNSDPSLWRRGGKFPPSSSIEAIERHSQGIVGISLTKLSQILTEKIDEEGVQYLPSIWFHEGHGSEFGLAIESQQQRQLGGEEIKQHLLSTKGIIDFAWLNSCHSVELVQRHELIKTGKITTILGHLGMGDEAGNVVAFEMLVLERILQGHSLGKSIQFGKSAMDMKMSASGSFTLLGDPRLVLMKANQRAPSD